MLKTAIWVFMIYYLTSVELNCLYCILDIIEKSSMRLVLDLQYYFLYSAENQKLVAVMKLNTPH